MAEDHIGGRVLAAGFGLLAGLTCMGATVLAVMVVNAFPLGSWTSIAGLLVLLGMLVLINRALVAVVLHLHEKLFDEPGLTQDLEPLDDNGLDLVRTRFDGLSGQPLGNAR